ncbi:MAG: prolipoprotein diacylglyceryl transferase [Proteobacteria bacterium]|nr:prolipoprotein diacylglyceryl transferase [Pseudomonadota bacterium]
MYPDLLEIFGVTLHGPIFERVLWILLAILMIWGIVSSVLLIKNGKKAEGGIQGVIVGAILIWSITKIIETFSADYAIMFQQPLVIHSYAFCILLGIIAGTLTAMKMAPSRDLEGLDMARLCLWMVLIGFLGARAAHVIVDYQTYVDSCFHPELMNLDKPNCLRVLDFGEGGLTFYGGVIAGFFVVAAFFYRRHKKGKPLHVLSVFDLLAAALAITHAFGRLGCLAAGCCWGEITTGTLGVKYGADSFAFAEYIKDSRLHDVMMKTGETPLVHATQIYESLGELILYICLWVMLKKGAKPGKMAGTWFIGYGVLRFIVEIMRNDTERGYYFEQVVPSINAFFNIPASHVTFLSTSQGIAIVMVAVGAILLAFSHKRKDKAVAEQAPEKAEDKAEAEEAEDKAEAESKAEKAEAESKAKIAEDKAEKAESKAKIAEGKSENAEGKAEAEDKAENAEGNAENAEGKSEKAEGNAEKAEANKTEAEA